MWTSPSSIGIPITPSSRSFIRWQLPRSIPVTLRGFLLLVPSVPSRITSASFAERSSYMDHDQREIVLDGNVVVMYDYLIIATGVTANFFGISGAREHSMPLYRRSQALKLRDKIFAEFEDSAMNDHDRDLRIVVVGAGPTGVETAGALAEMRNNDLPVTYPELDSSRIEITLVEMGPAVLGPFDESLREYSAEALRERGVNLRLGTAVKEVTEKGVVVEHEGEQTLP